MSTTRLAYLDVLKAIAIFAVVLYHAGILHYGYLGVDVFLVLSGFFVTKSLERKKYFSFVGSRTLRLLPVLLAAGLIAMVAGWFAMLPDDYENLGESVVATNLFANNILSAITTRDYWSIANEYRPLMHTWYVGLLMQFCLVYPLLVYLARLDKKTPRRTLLVILCSLGLLSLLVYFAGTNEVNRFYYLPARFFEFAAGGIVALVYEPSRDKPFHPAFSYVCYALLMGLLIIGFRIMPDAVRLVLVVALTVMLVMSGEALAGSVFSNKVLAKVGVASYSIYVWHQVLFAFYRYVFGNQFTAWRYLLLFVAVGLVSWASYWVIEQGVSRTLGSESGRRGVFVAMISLFVLLTGFAGWVYKNAGVVRDVPELAVSVQDRHRRMHAEYNEQAYRYDMPFASAGKQHWLVVGDSFGRDFVNTVLSSEVAHQVELSYTDDFSTAENSERFAAADRVFIATRVLNMRLVSAVEVECWSAGLSPDKVIVIGEKNFGENNGHIYVRRHRPDYYGLCVEPEGGERFFSRNNRFREFYGERFVDLMSMVSDDSGRVRVFTPDSLFISADCRHLTAGGARYFAERIDWSRFL